MRFRIPPSTVGQGLFSSKSPSPEIRVSEGFDRWLGENRVSLAFTERGKGAFYGVGLGSGGTGIAISKVKISEGGAVWSDGHRLWLSSRDHLHGFLRGEDRSDTSFMPGVTVATGPLNIQDILLDADGVPFFLSARANCLATVSFTSPFKVIWRPPFLTEAATQDCCHLSGMAHDGRQVRYVTLFSPADTVEGWQSSCQNRGELWDIVENRPICQQLTLPTAPRFHRGKLWMLHTNTAEIGVVDPVHGRFSPVYTCPAFPTGLDFFHHYALIGISHQIGGIVPDAVHGREGQSRCGLIVLDINKARLVHWLRLERNSVEVASVAFLPNTTMPLSMATVHDDRSAGEEVVGQVE